MGIVSIVCRALLCVVIVAAPMLVNAKSKRVSVKIDRRAVSFLGDCAGKVRSKRDGSITINLNDAFLIESLETARQRKICLIKLSMSIPEGWQMAISEIEFSGIADIQESGKGELALRHRFTGTAGAVAAKEIGHTGSMEDFQIKRSFKVIDSSYSPCGGKVQFKTSLTAQVVKGAIAISEGGGGAASIVYHSTFRECHRDR